VGSVTNTTKSAPRTVATTGQDVPGGESNSATASGMRRALTARISGGAIGSPTFRRPCAKAREPARPVSATPMARGDSRMAPTGQTSAHAPQPWHSSGKTSGFFSMAMALNSQTSAHLTQAMQRAASTTGTGMPTDADDSIVGLRNRCPLGSSTSQSRYWTACFRKSSVAARWTATVVLPVPPLPLAIAMAGERVTALLRPSGFRRWAGRARAVRCP